MADEVALLTGLLEHFSPTGQEAGAVQYLVDQMASQGFAAEIDGAGNAVGWLGDGPHEILLLGHIDTVPGQIPVRKEGDNLFGRGSVDAKGPLAAFTAAAARVGIRPGWRIGVIGAVAEEGDSHGARFLLSQSGPDFLVIGEPSGWERITLGYKGSAWYRFTVALPSAHTAANASSASELAVNFWNASKAYANIFNNGLEKAFLQLTPSLRSLQSGSDGFTETASLQVGFRLPPGLSPDELTQVLASFAQAGILESLDSIPAYRGEKNTPLVRAFLSSIRLAGGSPTFALKTGTADLNILAPHWGCPALAYGPGDSSLDHTPNEHISIAEYLKGVEVLEAVLLSITGSQKV